jgi:hypothetical protein
LVATFLHVTEPHALVDDGDAQVTIEYVLALVEQGFGFRFFRSSCWSVRHILSCRVF